MKIENKNIFQDIIYAGLGLIMVLLAVTMIVCVLALITEINGKAISECKSNGYSVEYCERMAR